MLFTILILFLLGMAIGSFLNVVIYRAVNDDSPLRGRSYCDSCKKPIAWYDNIPVISFIVLRRRCRHCKTVIPWEYPAVEFIVGTLFVWWYVVGFTFFQLSAQPFSLLQPLFWLAVGVIFVVIVFADLSYMIIPDSTVILLTLGTLGYRLLLVNQGVMQSTDFFYSIAAGVGASLFFLLLVLLTRGKGMGFGDVKLAFPLGLILGYPLTVLGIFLAFIIGSVVAVGLLALKRTHIKAMIPFGPFLIAGTVVTLVWGETLLSWYLSRL